MVDFSASQHVPEPPRKIKQTQFNEAEEEERTQKGYLELLVQGETSLTINNHALGGHAPTNPLNPDNPIIVQYNARQESQNSLYKSDIPGQEKPLTYQGNQEKDISGSYHP